MALKKPGELFKKQTNASEGHSLPISGSLTNIKEQFNKVEELKKQLEGVTSSIDSSLSEVVDSNLDLIAFRDEYSELLGEFNNKINNIEEDLNNKVNDLRRSHVSLKTGIEIVEKRQNQINIREIKEEVISEVENILVGNVSDNIRKLEEKVEIIGISYKKTLSEGLLNEPPSTDNSDPLTPLDKDYVTLQEFQAQYKIFLNRIQQQLATIGGGGAVRIQDLDDVDRSSAMVDGKVLEYDSSTGKWKGGDGSGTVTEAFKNIAVSGQSDIVADASTDTLNVVGGSNITVTTNATTDTLTIDAANDNTQLSTEQVQDIVGGMFSGNTETNITATYQDSDGTIDLVATDTNTQLSTEEVQDIVGAMFSGNTETNITATYQDSDGTIDLVSTDTNTQLSTEEVQDIVGAMFTGNTETNITATYEDSDGTIDLVASSGSEITVQDEGSSLSTAATTLNFTGAGVVASGTGATKTIDISGTTLTTEAVQDIVGAMFTGNTETNITATYEDSDGTIDLVATAGGALSSRADNSASTGSIAQTASANITINTQSKTFALLKVAISAPAWVVLYVDSASRSADSSRTEGTDPAPGAGVITEVSTTTSGASTFLMSPGVIGWNNDSTPAAQIYAKVTNKRATSGSNAITVTLTNMKLEA